jgi:hypothetical protein
VDRGVTSVYGFDFFLQAHAGLQGTTRPTHYFVVHDENNLSPDVIQTVTNNASYLYARATRSVSLIPPAYYADIACERGRCYIHDMLLGPSDNRSLSDADAEDEVMKQAKLLWNKGPGGQVGQTMFYI